MADFHKPLRDDVHLLGELLGDTLRADGGPQLFETVERVRALSKSAHAGHEMLISLTCAQCISLSSAEEAEETVSHGGTEKRRRAEVDCTPVTPACGRHMDRLTSPITSRYGISKSGL